MPTIIKREDPYRQVSIWGTTIKTKTVLVEQIARKMKNGFSPIIGICGGQRSGKSFIAVWLAYIIYKLRKEKLDPTKITFYDPEEAMKSLGDKNRDVVLIDEAGDVMDYQEWQKKTHRALRSMINTQAYKNNLYIFVSPFVAQIDKSLRVHCDFLINVGSRGRAKIWKYHKKYDADDIKYASRKTFLDDFSIGMKHLPAGIWKDYLKHSIESKERLRKIRIQKEQKKKGFEVDDLIELSRKVSLNGG